MYYYALLSVSFNSSVLSKMPQSIHPLFHPSFLSVSPHFLCQLFTHLFHFWSRFSPTSHFPITFLLYLLLIFPFFFPHILQTLVFLLISAFLKKKKKITLYEKLRQRPIDLTQMRRSDIDHFSRRGRTRHYSYVSCIFSAEQRCGSIVLRWRRPLKACGRYFETRGRLP